MPRLKLIAALAAVLFIGMFGFAYFWSFDSNSAQDYTSAKIRLPSGSKVFESSGREVLFNSSRSWPKLCSFIHEQLSGRGFTCNGAAGVWDVGQVIWYAGDGDVSVVLDDVRGSDGFGSETLPSDLQFHLWLQDHPGIYTRGQGQAQPPLNRLLLWPGFTLPAGAAVTESLVNLPKESRFSFSCPCAWPELFTAVDSQLIALGYAMEEEISAPESGIQQRRLYLNPDLSTMVYVLARVDDGLAPETQHDYEISYFDAAID